jgi:eukaryotic-like serine/threonine-protein kinase
MLTGAVPFTGDSPIAIAMRQVNEDVPPPSAMNPDVPAGLDEIVSRATAKDPSERFADARDMGEAIGVAIGDTSEAEPSTAVLTPAEPTVVNESSSVWPIPGSRWDPQRVGRAVLLTLGALVLIALLLLLFRLASDDAPEDNGGNSPPGAEVVTIPNNVTGMSFATAKDQLESLGLNVKRQVVESDLETGTVVDATPPPLTRVNEGSTVTLLVASGGDEGDEEHGNGEGKGNGKGKGKDGD